MFYTCYSAQNLALFLAREPHAPVIIGSAPTGDLYTYIYNSHVAPDNKSPTLANACLKNLWIMGCAKKSPYTSRVTSGLAINN